MDKGPSLSFEAKIGVILALFFGFGAGAMMVWPDQPIIGWGLMFIAALGGIILALHHFIVLPHGSPRTIGRNVVAGLIAIPSLIFFAYAGWYFVHPKSTVLPPSTYGAIENWNVKSDGTNPPFYSIDVHATPLAPYTDRFMAVLIVRNGSLSNVDPMSDIAIEESVPYTITLPRFTITFLGSGQVRYSTMQDNKVQFFLALLPKDVAQKKIKELNEVKKRGGNIIDVVEMNVPTNHSKVNPDMQTNF